MAVENSFEKRKLKEGVEDLGLQLDRRAETIARDFLSSDERILRLKEIARQVAQADVPVLILGESGVGKEVLARYIHAQSDRGDAPFVKVNCAALPHELLESELFGHEPGAFTGASAGLPGKFELAEGGSILLDEIAEMNPHLQAKFLHVLEDGECCRLGGKEPVRVNVRVFASTSRHLEKAMSAGEFREDVYFRLNVIKMTIPPLRERKGDIPLLCRHFLQKYRAQYHGSLDELPAELVEAFLAYDWPGNVRQLENAVKRYFVLRDVEASLSELRTGPEMARAPAWRASLKEVAAQAAEDAEKRVVRRMLEETNWNRKAAARRLNISYKALLNKLKKWQLDNRNDPKRLGLEV